VKKYANFGRAKFNQEASQARVFFPRKEHDASRGSLRFHAAQRTLARNDIVSAYYRDYFLGMNYA